MYAVPCLSQALPLALSLALTAVLLLAVPPNTQDAAAPAVTVLAPGRSVTLEGARVDGERLWVPGSSLEDVSGFTLEPRGLCAGELCIPMPPGSEWVREDDGQRRVDVTAVASHLEQRWVREGRTWSFARAPAVRRSTLLAGRAPELVLPDRDGRPVRLSDFRGRKVLLLTWASW